MQSFIMQALRLGAVLLFWGFVSLAGAQHFSDAYDKCKFRPCFPEGIGICTNTPAIGVGFQCSCPPGLVLLNGDRSCGDFDECDAGTHNCNPMANCMNTPYSFMCACKAGYSGNGLACSDIDECQLGTHQCASDIRCVNTQGSYTCLLPGAAPESAFEGSPRELSTVLGSLNVSFVDGGYWFRSSKTSAGRLKLQVENGFAIIPIGQAHVNTNSSGPTVLSLGSQIPAFSTVCAMGSAAEDGMYFDEQSRITNDNAQNGANSGEHQVVIDIGVPFGEIQFKQMAWESHTGSSNSGGSGSVTTPDWCNESYSQFSACSRSGTSYKDQAGWMWPVGNGTLFTGATGASSEVIGSGFTTGCMEQGKTVNTATSTLKQVNGRRTSFGFVIRGGKSEYYRLNEALVLIR